MNITEEQFYDDYCPIENHLDKNASFDGFMFETFGEELEYIKSLCENENDKKRIWTVIAEEDDLGNIIIEYMAGLHLVNRIGFLVTEKPYTLGTEVVIIESGDND